MRVYCVQEESSTTPATAVPRAPGSSANMMPLPSAGLALCANTDGPNLVAAAAPAAQLQVPRPDADNSVRAGGSTAGWTIATSTVAALQQQQQQQQQQPLLAAIQAAAVGGDPAVRAAMPVAMQQLLPEPWLVQQGVQLLLQLLPALLALLSQLAPGPAPR